MGFGLLFIGYFMATLMSMSPLGGALIRVLGYLIILASSLKLRKYNKSFNYLCIGSVGMLMISVIIAVFGLLSDMSVISSTSLTVIGHAERVGYLLFVASMCVPVKAIADETEVSKISVAAMRNLIFTAVYFVLYFIAYLPFPFVEDYGKYFGAPVFVFYIVLICMNLYMIFSCYAKICDENDASMAIKPSRFAFVNRFREENERRRAEADAKYEQKRKEKAERRRNGKK